MYALYFISDATIFDDQRFGRKNSLNTFNYKYCSNDHVFFSQCIEVRKGSSNYISYSRCTTEYGLRCYSKIIGILWSYILSIFSAFCYINAY